MPNYRETYNLNLFFKFEHISLIIEMVGIEMHDVL